MSDGCSWSSIANGQNELFTSSKSDAPLPMVRSNSYPLSARELTFGEMKFMSHNSISLLCIVLLSSWTGEVISVEPPASGPKAIIAQVEAVDLKALGAFFREIEKAYASSRKPGEKTRPSEQGVWWMPEPWCVKKLGYPKKSTLERCIVREIGARRAAAIIAVRSCESEHCDTDYFIHSGRLGVRKIDMELGDDLIVSSDSRGFFIGHMDYVVSDDNSAATGYQTRLSHVEFKTLKRRHVANCTVPVLSPSGRWVVCRDRDGNVHRMSRDGKHSRRIHIVDLAGERISGDAHIGLHITPVKFLADGRLRVETLTTGETDVEVIKWQEN